jgi:hypothetical protein
MDGGTEALLFSLLANGTTHDCQLPKSLSHAGGTSLAMLAKPTNRAVLEAATAKKLDFYGLSRFINEKNRIKCG